MNFFWPTRRKAETTALIRLGRVAHWLSIAFAAAFALAGIFARGQTTCDAEPWLPGCPPPPTWFEDWGAPILASLAAAFVISMIGRGFRYILAGE